MKRALITGITGQDGSYLVELLLKKGYAVYGIVRKSGAERLERVAPVLDRIRVVQADLADEASLEAVIQTVQPDEVYNLAGQSFVPASFVQPTLTGDITGLGTTRILESIRKHKPDARFYQASTSEMFGRVREAPQNELTPFHPRSPYGVAKVYAHYMTVNYRECHNLFALSGILYNHESPRRGLEFVTRKVTDGVARVKLGLAKELRMGNLDAQRDWGFAGDYVEAMWLMLQQDKPEDYVIATGETHSVKDLVETAFACAGLRWEDHVVIDPKFVRPAEVDLLVGDASKAKRQLGWQPKVTFEEMVRMMVDADLKRLSG